MTYDWSSLFDNFGLKIVSRTDKMKSAYLPSEGQRNALMAAGIFAAPADEAVVFQIEVLFDSTTPSVTATYYKSMRYGSGRDSELRMGRSIISSWLQESDEVVIGNVGNRLLAARTGFGSLQAAEIGHEFSRKFDSERILRNAEKAFGQPERKERTSSDFVRNPYVVAATLHRANGFCEMPNCTSELFSRDDGTAFLEVHHITPLAEGGDDTLLNAAALCPMCHRELHFGSQRRQKRAVLHAYVASIRRS
jgi:predicted HNH restriction endonuclease